MNLRVAKKNDSKQIAEIHKKEIDKGFLSSFNLSFLEKIYSSLIGSKNGFCIVAEDHGGVIGFVAGANNLRKFYWDFFRNGYLSSLRIIFSELFNPSRMQKIFEVLCYPYKGNQMPKAELLTIAVRAEFQGQGIAPELLKKFVLEMKKRNVISFRAVVGQELSHAISFYEKNNFFLRKEIQLHGRKSRIYIYNVK